MTGWNALTRKLALLGTGIALVILAAPRAATAQAAPPQDDILKFSSPAPVIIVNQIKADKTTEFEEGWAGIRAFIEKSENPDLKTFGETLAHLYRVDQPAFDTPNGKAVIYIFNISAPSTTYSYNPRMIIYEALKAGQEGSKITRAEADVVYNKLTASYLAINPPWVLVKAK
jgi:hypothetical protein